MWQNRYLFNPFVINLLLKELRSLLHSFRSPLLIFFVLEDKRPLLVATREPVSISHPLPWKSLCEFIAIGKYTNSDVRCPGTEWDVQYRD